MIRSTINQKIGEAMKARDEVRLSVLRMLSSAFNYEQIAKQHELSEDEELVVVKKEAKIRTDAIAGIHEAMGKKSTSSPEELKNKLTRQETELKILKEFLPEEISGDELNQIIDQVIKESNVSDLKGMGQVIGIVKAKVGMRSDGSIIAALVKNKLAKISDD
jgi:uncharacterized protein